MPNLHRDGKRTTTTESAHEEVDLLLLGVDPHVERLLSEHLGGGGIEENTRAVLVDDLVTRVG